MNNQTKDDMETLENKAKDMKKKVREIETERNKKTPEQKKAEQKERNAKNSEQTHREREQVLTLTIVYRGQRYVINTLKGKDCVGALRQELVKLLDIKKNSKFRFLVRGIALHEFDPTKTLRKAGVIDNDEIEAELIESETDQNNDDAQPSGNTEADDLATHLGGEQEDEQVERVEQVEQEEAEDGEEEVSADDSGEL